MKPQFFRRILPNGMTIILEKRNLPVVSVAFAVRAGGINEKLSEKGISHFIEHLLYKGTKKRKAKQIAEEIEKNGGEMNGFTSEEVVAYWCRLPSKKLNIALDVLSDIIKNSVFDSKEIEKERKVIFEEIKMRKDNPRIFALDEIQKCLYTDVLSISDIGTVETLSSMNREKIVKKFTEIYTPNNLILCVVGDANFEDLVNFAQKNFGNKRSIIPEQIFNLKREIKIEKRKGIDSASLVFAYPVFFKTEKEAYTAEILHYLMAEGLSSRLFAEIREKRNLAYSIFGGSEINKRYGYNFIYVGTKKENIEKVKKIILKEFEKVAKSLKSKELNSIKLQLIGNYFISMENSIEQLNSLIRCEIQGNSENFYNFEKNISLVELKDVKNLASQAIKKYGLFVLVPQN